MGLWTWLTKTETEAKSLLVKGEADVSALVKEAEDVVKPLQDIRGRLKTIIISHTVTMAAAQAEAIKQTAIATAAQAAITAATNASNALGSVVV